MVQKEKNVSPMSNEERNRYVVTHITKSLFDLLEIKSFESISISEICANAEVGRMSFYRNFESKEDIIRKHLKKMLDKWFNQYTGEGAYQLIESIFDHYYKNKDLCILLYNRGLAHLSLESIKNAFGPKPEQSNIQAYTTSYFAYGLYGWLEEWFKRGMQENAQQMAKMWMEEQTKSNQN